jgi:VanZ family protein
MIAKLPPIARVTAWILAATIVVLSIVPPALRPETGAPHSLEHFVIYCLTCAAFARGYNLRRDLLAVLLVIFAGAIEVAQLFVPGRHARLSDFIVDALAGLVGLALASLAKQHCGHEASH